MIGHPVSIGGKLAFTTYLPKYAPDGSLDGCYLYVIINGMEDARVITKRISELSSQVEFYKQELSRERGARYNLDSIIGRSRAILQLKEQIVQAAKSSSTVLIQGETGSGKELIAHAIHSLSPRHAASFVRVNCSAIPANLWSRNFSGIFRAPSPARPRRERQGGSNWRTTDRFFWMRSICLPPPCSRNF